MNTGKSAVFVLLLLMITPTLAFAEAADNETVKPVWREDFNSMPAGSMPAGWEIKTKPGTKTAEFSVVKDPGSDSGWLVMQADKASATLMVKPKVADPRKAPILRWRWRVTTFPEGADGRVAAKDDQAIGVYVSSGGLRQRSLAYRWETETPVGEEGMVTYVGGVVKVKWICLRNKKDGDGKKFFIEERNAAEDFKKAFGYVPDKIGIGVSCNSQYTGTKAEAQFDWIEMLPKPTGNKQ